MLLAAGRDLRQLRQSGDFIVQDVIPLKVIVLFFNLCFSGFFTDNTPSNGIGMMGRHWYQLILFLVFGCTTISNVATKNVDYC